MPVEVKLNFNTMEECAEAMIKLAGTSTVLWPTPGVDEAPKAAEEKPKAKRAPKSKPKAETEEPKQNIQANPEDRKEPETVDEPEAPTEPEMSDEDAQKLFTEGVRPALSSLMAATDQENARKFLTEFGGLGAEKLSDIPKEHYQAFIDACKKRVAEENA